MIRNPIYAKIKNGHQTTNQKCFEVLRSHVWLTTFRPFPDPGARTSLTLSSRRNWPTAPGGRCGRLLFPATFQALGLGGFHSHGGTPKMDGKSHENGSLIWKIPWKWRLNMENPMKWRLNMENPRKIDDFPPKMDGFGERENPHLKWMMTGGTSMTKRTPPHGEWSLVATLCGASVDHSVQCQWRQFNCKVHATYD